MPIPVPMPVPMPMPMPMPMDPMAMGPMGMPFGKRSIENTLVLKETETNCMLYDKTSKLNCTG